MRVARFLFAGAALWSGFVAWPALAQPRPAPPRAPADAPQAAFEALKARPWYAQFKAVLAETNALGVSRIDGGFADIWLESEALGEATKRIDDGMKGGRPAPLGAVNDAIDLQASGLVARAGCYAALMQRSEFAAQATALAALKVGGKTPEAIAHGVKQYAQGPCQAPQLARNLDPRRVWESGKEQIAKAFASGSMPTLAKFLDERQLLKAAPSVDVAKPARASVEADFRRFDALYEGHADLLRSYRSLLGDYCPTDQRFCGLRDMLAEWSNPDTYCENVARYIAASYGDADRLRYLDGAENDGLNRAWEAYHLKFAPACVQLTKRADLIALVNKRLDVAAPLFAADERILGVDGVTRLRDALRDAQAAFDADNGAQGRIDAYRAAAGLDGRVASVNPSALTGQPPPQAGVTPPVPATPMASEGPSIEELRVRGTMESERELRLSRGQIRDIQERLLAIGFNVNFSNSVNGSTRSALRSWQGAVGLEPTGFLTKAQLDLLKIRTEERWNQWRAGPEADAGPGGVQGAPPARRREVRRRAPRYYEGGGRGEPAYERGLIPARPSPFGGLFR